MMGKLHAQWKLLIMGYRKWMGISTLVRDPASAEFARVIAEVFAMRLCEPDQGSTRKAVGVLAAGQRRKKVPEKNKDGGGDRCQKNLKFLFAPKLFWPWPP